MDALILLKYATANITLSALLERSYDDHDLHKVFEHGENYQQALNSSSHVDFVPLIKYLPNKALSGLALSMKTVLEIITKMFEKNKETYADGQVRNFADCFLSVVEKEREKEKSDCQTAEDTLNMAPLLNDGQIVSAMIDLFGGGFETTSTTLYWSLAYLVKYPEIQRQIQN